MSRICRPMRGSVIASLCLAGALGCKSTPPPSAQQPAPREEPRAVATTPAPAPKSLDLRAVYFDFERWDLRDDARAALKQYAKELNDSTQWTRLTVEGHCDERGSEEYNMALGERRAATVERFLKDLGVPSTRVNTVSYGEDRPAAKGHDESSWQLNRRAELVVKLPQQASR